MAVTFRIYASNGSTLLHTFSTVFSANFPHTEKNLIEHTNPRGKGSIIVDGGNSSWDLIIKGVIFASGYYNLMTAVDSMESNIVLNTPYVITISDGSKTYSYNCKRILPIEYQDDSLRTDYLEYNCILRILSW